MRKISLSLVLLLFNFFSPHCFAQFTYKLDKNTRFERIGVDQGLSSEYSYCMHQDKYGFIWIGSLYGLNLYDGYDVKTFNVDLQNPRSIYNHSIRCIYEEPDGTMWFGTGTGISKYDRSTGYFTNYIPDSLYVNKRRNVTMKILPYRDKLWVLVVDGLFLFDKKTGLFNSYKGDSVNPSMSNYYKRYDNILVDQSENLWFASLSIDGRNALSKYDKKTDKIIYFLNDPSDPESFNGKEVMEIIEDKEGTLWAATYGGGLLEIIDKEHGKFKQYLHNENDQHSSPLIWLYTVFEDSKGNLWTGGINGFTKFNKATKQYTNFRIPKRSYDQFMDNTIHRIYEDAKGELWLSSWDGVFSFNPSKKILSHFIHDLDNQNTISGHIVIQVMQDLSDQIWILQLYNGINKLNHLANAFIKTEKIINNQSSLCDNHVLQILGDSKGNLWVGTRTGLNRTSLIRTKEYTNFEHYFSEMNDTNSINDNRIYILHEDRNQTLWIASTGLNRFDPGSNNFVRYLVDETDTSNTGSNIIEAIFEDSYGTFWISTRGGMHIMDRTTGTFIRLIDEKKYEDCKFSAYTGTIYEDIHGDVWFGGNNLRKLSRPDTCLTDFNPNTAINNQKYRIAINSFGEDGLGNLWLATSMGLLKLNRGGLDFTKLTVDNGLPSNGIAAIETDGNGNLWVSTKNGISRINPRDYSIRNFDMGDGLVCLEFVDDCSYKDEDGWLYFGGRQGFNVFHPDSIKDNKHVPPVYITALNIARQPKYFEDVIYNMNNIELMYNENDFSFDFVALDYINPPKNQFAYMLEGYDKDWIYVGNRRTAHYTNMSPGDYTFRVKASNNNGYWNEEGASIALVIHPPMWKTWWAYSIYAFALLSLFYILYRNELKRLNLKRDLEIEHIQTEKLIEVDREKANFFANVSHEFKTPLTLILGPIDKAISVLKDGKIKKELSIALRNAKRLQTLINQLLSLSKLESGKMKLKAREENIVQLVKVYIQSFESLAKQKQVELIFDSPLEDYLLMVDRLKVEKIMNNLLSNAFKFIKKGGKIKVSISMATAPPDLCLTGGQDTSERIGLSAGDSSNAEGILIKISDTGIGIKEEDLKQIFNRFYQVESGHSRGYEGTGIGLALAKELVELHQGTIKVESEFDSGTTVIVFLPAGTEHLNQENHVSSSSPDHEVDVGLLVDDYVYDNSPLSENISEVDLKQSDRNLPLILIVEDNSDMRAYIKGYLEQSYHIIEAVNGEDGFNKATEHIPNLIITDLMMPVMDGNELTGKLKLDQRTSHIPVIILTAKVNMESKLEGLETGADDFLTKPFDVQELLIRIRNLIILRQKLRILLRQQIENADQIKNIQAYQVHGMSKLDEQFLEKAINVVEGQIINPDFSVEMFAGEMAMSRKHLHRKLTSLIDHSPNNLIRNIRLKKAAELLKKGELNVTEVTYEVGISSLSYFAKAFKEKYGVSPSDYA